MASPLPNPQVGGWSGSHQMMPPQPEADDSGMQIRPMGLKVHYTFDKEGKINCLARYPQTLHLQTIPVDSSITIGVVDLRLCIQAVAECSPELAGQDCDYTIYAYDYSEPDTPLVGQGMLSWSLDSMRAEYGGQLPKMVTGRVTKNLLGVFGGGNRETLEVKLKLTEATKIQRSHEGPRHMEMSQPQPQPQPQPTNRPTETVMTPAGTAEWNSFLQSNPQIGHTTDFSRGASPALSQGQPPAMPNRSDSFPQVSQVANMQPNPNMQRIAPTPVDATGGPVPTSRPSSRASNSGRSQPKKQPTGRPRGRPRKKPIDGSTSGYEDGTEGEDGGPSKKRAKITKVAGPNTNAFGAGPDSLRVAASISGSLRNFRPIAIGSEGIGGSHLQEIPRAPTPVPNGPVSGMPGRVNKTGLRRESTMSHELLPNQPYPQSERQRALSPSQEDGRSPESAAPTPTYSDDSPAEIGSSPPVPRTTSFIRSSPPPSSPILPPMPQSRLSQDGGFENELDDLFGEISAQPRPVEKAPTVPQPRKRGSRKTSSVVPVQVFRMEDGPDGQDMVHIGSYNTPEPSSFPAAPQSTAHMASAAKRPLKARQPQSTALPSPPTLVPTPPPTTDAAEKPLSPASGPDSFLGAPPMALPNTFLPPNPPSSAREQKESTSEHVSQAYFAQLAREVPSRRNSEGAVADSASLQANTGMEASQPPAPVAAVGPNNNLSMAIPEPTTQSQKPPRPRAKPRKLVRSQSDGPFALPTAPPSEPARPSSLSQVSGVEPENSFSASAMTLRRSTSSIALDLPVPASDPVRPLSMELPSLALPIPAVPTDATLPPPSSPTGKRSNKNVVKKYAIKQRLESAIDNGEMPPYCRNCGAIQTPTWRKIWVQDRDGPPEPVELSAKPGRITAVQVIELHKETNEPIKHRLTKKSLADDDDKKTWECCLLCNPCGIWLVKSLCHRPEDRWEKDANRLGQERRKRGSGQDPNRPPKPRKPRSKSDVQARAQSETYLLTDIIRSTEPSSPKNNDGPAQRAVTEPAAAPDRGSAEYIGNAMVDLTTESANPLPNVTEKSPINLSQDDGMGSTKRLLFPSPRKDGSPKVLGELDINIVQTIGDCHQPKEPETEKENVPVHLQGPGNDPDDLEALFRSPMPPRPTTPLPSSKTDAPASAFKTPTRATPSHRPITRSVSRSVRSMRSWASPKRVQKTPTRTPQESLNPPQTPLSRRRSPRHQDNAFEEPDWNTPVSRAISQLLSDNPILSDPNFGGFSDDMEMDFGDLPPLETSQHMVNTVNSWFSTDAAMPTTSPKHMDTFPYDGANATLDDWNLNIPRVHKEGQ